MFSSSSTNFDSCLRHSPKKLSEFLFVSRVTILCHPNFRFSKIGQNMPPKQAVTDKGVLDYCGAKSIQADLLRQQRKTCMEAVLARRISPSQVRVASGASESFIKTLRRGAADEYDMALSMCTACGHYFGGSRLCLVCRKTPATGGGICKDCHNSSLTYSLMWRGNTPTLSGAHVLRSAEDIDLFLTGATVNDPSNFLVLCGSADGSCHRLFDDHFMFFTAAAKSVCVSVLFKHHRKCSEKTCADKHFHPFGDGVCTDKEPVLCATRPFRSPLHARAIVCLLMLGFSTNEAETCLDDSSGVINKLDHPQRELFVFLSQVDQRYAELDEKERSAADVLLYHAQAQLNFEKHTSGLPTIPANSNLPSWLTTLQAFKKLSAAFAHSEENEEQTQEQNEVTQDTK